MAKPPPMPASAAKPKSAKALGKQPSFMAGKSKPFGAPAAKGAAKMFGASQAGPGAAAARKARLAGKKL